jgi:hypothetical protein
MLGIMRRPNYSGNAGFATISARTLQFRMPDTRTAGAFHFFHDGDEHFIRGDGELIVLGQPSKLPCRTDARCKRPVWVLLRGPSGVGYAAMAA